MIKSLSIILSAAVLAVLVASGPARSESAAAPLALRVSVDKTVFRKGQFPEMKVTVINRGGDPVTLVEPGDGSEIGWRTPIIGWSILPASDASIKHPTTVPLFYGRRCSNMNSLKAQEIFSLPPGTSHVLAGGSFEEVWFSGFEKRPAGKYRIVFYYRNDPTHPWRGYGPGGKAPTAIKPPQSSGSRLVDTSDIQDPAAIKQIEASTPCLLVSNELIVTVRE